ncbi:hypothetical protein I0C86_23515 [Plantactinospora sp. S1510]|uniref:Uncharacterized protein n=1 Tax=Plantactinospora alkalitolerans TaxID=2789879 RepID=A0ABS0H0C0_9ACTN|nr:hypothetical protein [Plantactinospora alkalitolerans]MBF9131908.1 hypothetical protein [Plantactinospora alkalitolerans]
MSWWNQFWQAWNEWAGGASVSSMPLWGLTVIWWARIGKLLQFAAGLTVVLDLIGPQRLRAFGQSCSSAIQQSAARIGQVSQQQGASGAIVPFVMFSALASTGVGLMAIARDVFPGTSLGTIALTAIAVVAIILAARYFRLIPQLTKLAFLGFAGILVELFVRPVSYILDNANPGHLIRWIAFFAFIAGFSLDLLGS